jgi:4-hydroxy-2-oxoheptanedioate aldolase
MTASSTPTPTVPTVPTVPATPTTLREHWNSGALTLGVWLTIPSTISAEAAARTDYDYVCLDTQHGAIDYQTSVAMAQAILLGGGHPIARVPWNEPGIIGKTLDAGIEGVIVPMVNTVAQAEAVVQASRYPPLGSRSYGPVMAGMRRADHHGWSTDGIAVIPMIETVEAMRNLDAILAVPGIDAIYVGPADLSASLGLKPQNNDGETLFDDALVMIASACKRAGIVAGIHTTAPLVARRVEQGYQMITVTSDVLAMRSQLAADLAVARGSAPKKSSSSMY